MTAVRPIAIRVAIFVAGAVVGVASLVVYRHAWSLGIDLPWGLLLALVATYSCVRASALIEGGSAGAICFALGWLAALIYVFGGRDEGDYLIAADWLGYGFLLGGVAVLGAAVVRSMSTPRQPVRDAPPRI